MIEIDNIYNMDCIEGMKLMANGSVDAVIADLPYGVLNRSNKAVHWDRQIPLEALWEQYRRITKPGSPVILFAQGIFSARLMLSQPRMWRYNLVWRKDRVTGHLNANRMPLRQHEDIIVFYDRQPLYHPQMTPCPPERRNHGRRKTDGFTNRCYGEMKLGYPEGFRDTSDIYEAEVLYMTPKKKKIKRKQWIGLVFIAPWLIGLIGLQVYPFVASLFYSFTEYNIMSSPKWIGLANYVKLFTADNEFWYSVKVTLIYTIFTVPGKLTVALIVALVMNKNMKGINFIRTIYYIPSLIGGSIGIAILWKLMFQEEGIINSLLKAIHLPTLHWLGDPKTALPTIILLQLWTFGSSFVMFLAALKNVPVDLYEAADIDGASSWKKFVKITLPQISSIIFFNIIMQTITALQSFTSSLVITNGGPLKSTYVLGMKLYTEAFSFYKMGYACAISWVIFIMIMIVTMILFRFSSMMVYYEDGNDF